jgi:hypothetical protein
LKIIDESGQIRHLLSRGDSYPRKTKFRDNLFIRVVVGSVSFPTNPIPVGRFDQVDKMMKFSHIKGRICFLNPFEKCVTSCLDLKKGINCDEN